MSLLKRLFPSFASQNAFNDALSIYQSLRRYLEYSSQYREALIKTAALSQEAINYYERNGDAHVLLANTYYLLYIDIRTTVIPLEFAAAVIQHWYDEPMRRYPWTKNVNNGLNVYSMVYDSIESINPHINYSIEEEMIRLKKLYYSNAITRMVLVDLKNEIEE